jgi:hypothetical protein
VNTLVETPLEYARPAVGSGRRRLTRVALALSLIAPACLVVSVTMYVLMKRTGVSMNGVLRTVQLTLAWASIIAGPVALATAGVAIARHPRGGREIAALTASLIHATLVLAAFKYLQ